MSDTIIQAGLALAFLTLSVAIIFFIFNFADVTTMLFRQQTSGMVADRIAGNAHVVQSYPNGGSIEIDLEDRYYISLEESEHDLDYAVINVTFPDGDPGLASFPAPDGFETGTPLVGDAEITRLVCISSPGSSREVRVVGDSCG